MLLTQEWVHRHQNVYVMALVSRAQCVSHTCCDDREAKIRDVTELIVCPFTCAAALTHLWCSSEHIPNHFHSETVVANGHFSQTHTHKCGRSVYSLFICDEQECFLPADHNWTYFLISSVLDNCGYEGWVINTLIIVFGWLIQIIECFIGKMKGREIVPEERKL